MSVPTIAGHVTRILLLAAFIVIFYLNRRRPSPGGRFPLVLWCLAGVALLAHLDFLATPHLHTHEFFHYYVTTKYFPEVGYSGLYDATVVADHEDDPSSFDPDQGVRSLTTYQLESRRSILERADTIRAPFPPGRWAAFKRDIAFFRDADGPLWKEGDSLRDHGYNGSPLVTAILGGLARQPFLPAPLFIKMAAWLDIALVIAAGVIVALLFDAVGGPLFVFLWAVNPLNDHAYIGGAYLRYLHILALFVALLAYARRRFVVSGAALAIATLLRAFPGFLVAGLLAQNLLSRDRRALLRRHAPLFAAAAATALILLGATSFIRSPDGENAWRGFAGKLSLHSQRISPNVLGLGYLFFYSDAHNVEEILKARKEGRNLNWIVEAGLTSDAHRGLYLGAAAALGAALLLLLRRGRPEDGFFAGLAIVFVLLHLAHYDYSVLALVPFIYPGRRVLLAALAVFWLAASAAILLPKSMAVMDYRFFVLSALTSLWFVAMIAIRLRREPQAIVESTST